MKIVNTDSCPMPLQDDSINVENHLIAIKEKGLGPADPRQSNPVFWQDKAKKWNVTEGDARDRLCSNCRFYVNATVIKDCIANLPVKNLKASDLPLNPKWADIESTPQAYCTLLDITCSPVRTCDFQQMGGPIDDDKMKLPEFKDVLSEDADEYSYSSIDKMKKEMSSEDYKKDPEFRKKVASKISRSKVI